VQRFLIILYQLALNPIKSQRIIDWFRLEIRGERVEIRGNNEFCYARDSSLG
jgi:hypothetical protein